MNKHGLHLLLRFCLHMPNITQLNLNYIIIDQGKVLCGIQANQSNKADVIEITKACIVAFMKAINSFVVQCREKHVNWKKNRFWLASKSYSWFNEIVQGRSSIKGTS